MESHVFTLKLIPASEFILHAILDLLFILLVVHSPIIHSYLQTVLPPASLRCLQVGQGTWPDTLEQEKKV